MTIAVYFDDTRKMGYPFNKKHYYEAYKAFAKLCESHNVDLCFARGKDNYLGHMKFKKGYRFVGDNLLSVPSFKANIIYVKGHDIQFSKDDVALNHPRMISICHDKIKTFEHFSQYMAPTYPITRENCQDVLDKIKTEKIVLKPVFGAEGEGIVVIEKERFDLAKFDLSQPYFVQEFIDGKGGIPGLVKGLHDLRLTLFNGEIKHCFIRKPKKGSYLANLAQGASFIYVPIRDLPHSAIQLAKKIDKTFSLYIPRLYAIDIMYEKDTPYLLELNDQPGLPFLEENKYENSAFQFQKYLLSILTTAVQRTTPVVAQM